ncbi:hypothetical protein PGT21_033812 [Puccinia graminis f. sp. tritici]|uniref:Uncharacterized protein n=1 Tax=Puccinia graminis f. sp. tritici TaxID=56615 RepID=A0A5B0QK25_PUCGR|nr:hypothetical protein PGT21_033812 [Puccinia graminis f. sp. tritici]
MNFPLEDYSIPAKLSLLLVDSIDSPANFILLQLISNALRNHRAVILLLTDHDQNYWLSLLNKNRVNQLLLTIIQPKLDEDIKLLLTQQLTKSKNKNPLVIINNLSSIIWNNNLPTQQLTQSFKALLPSQLNHDFSLVYLFHNDLIKNNNNRDREIFIQLINSSDIILRTRALGGQAQTQGELIIQRGPAYLGDLNLPITTSSDRTVQFKIQDHSVSFHPKGLDKAFI